MKEVEFLKRLQETFRLEAEERLSAMSSGLLMLEKEDDEGQRALILESIYREAHSIKGASRAASLNEIEQLSHSMESILSSMKRQELAATPELFDALHRAVDIVRKLLYSAPGTPQPGYQEILQSLTGVSNGVFLQPPSGQPMRGAALPGAQIKEASVAQVKPDSSGDSDDGNRIIAPSGDDQTVRIRTAKLDSLLGKIEEMRAVRLAAEEMRLQLNDIMSDISRYHRTVRELFPGLKKEGWLRKKGTALAAEDADIDRFIEFNRDFACSIESRLSSMAVHFENYRYSTDLRIDDLLMDARNVLMQPFSSLIAIFPRMIRELSRDQGKDIEFIHHGGEIEIDRRILQEMKDPLIHLLRNSIDHGIERPEERQRCNKPEKGTITLSVEHAENASVVIQLSDDGAGIDILRLKRSIVEKVAITVDQADRIDESEALSMIFMPDVSTSSSVTTISGRGLGLAIVKERVEKFGGSIEVRSSPGKGMTFRITLPVTIAAYRGVLVRCAGHLLMIPTAPVERILRLRRDAVKSIESRKAISLDGRTISLVSLARTLELEGEKPTVSPELITIVVMGSRDRPIAFEVDEIISEQEVMTKSLGSHLSRIRNISSATVLGNGKVVPVLNVSDLMKSSLREAVKTPPDVMLVPYASPARKQKILVVEDSITSRMLMKNILESAGYEVSIAMDGAEGWMRLKTEEYDLVVSDVAMPRMDGIELSSKIRGDARLSELPIILVTTLGTREDRERGIDAGANAYIVKSSFDRSDLLEAIGRLI